MAARGRDVAGRPLPRAVRSGPRPSREDDVDARGVARRLARARPAHTAMSASRGDVGVSSSVPVAPAHRLLLCDHRATLGHGHGPLVAGSAGGRRAIGTYSFRSKIIIHLEFEICPIKIIILTNLS